MDYTQRVTGSSQQITDYNRAQVALGDNTYQSRAFVNNTGAELTVVKGLVLGVLNTGANAGKVAPFDSTDIEGAQQPVFVSNSHKVLAIDEEVNLPIIDDGEVYGSMLAFVNGSDGLDVNIDTVGTPRDLLMKNSAGIKAINVDDATGYDN